MLFQNKRGAMFGLDARIALAIFGALSVISGAALYSAIQDARALSLYQDLLEVGKAWETYLLDTGSDLPGIGSQHRDVSYLVENKNSDINWRGPYLSYELDGSYLKHPGFDGLVRMPSTPNNEWGFGHASDTTWFANRCDDISIHCYTSIQVYGIEEFLFNIIDKKIDGEDGAFKGKIRMYKNPDIILNIIYTPYKSV